ncbi:ABC transporter permease [Aquabacterium sp. J223]|uniref:ABC transporter permease n=1 Tax=Aquabacterium sp. J223 TaxID=2898431 RepID=UPI0021AD7D0D|nr:ABC transporter permease [Aquabacterium sp. J223]UUX95036.1 ABC transporter permease [Aquabacterium sp. J223]
MTALDRKLLRDLRLMWSQALTIALVVASGVGGFITTLSAVDSLALARDRFYAQGRFADVFASVKRAPTSLVHALREIPGIADVQATIEQTVRVELPGASDPIIGILIGVDPGAPPSMNRLTVRTGRMPDTQATAGTVLPALVSPGFAEKRGLAPGAQVEALINGHRRTLQITGVALSPEYVFAGLMGMPDLRGVGVFWVPGDALAAAYDMKGAFNRVAVKLAPGASERAVIDALTARLARFGGREARGREDQPSHAMLANEIKEQQVLGTVLPAIFLAVAAFLLNVVVSRLLATQREQIAALKALGYANRAIAAHYLKLVLLIVGVGLLLGVALGDRLGTMFTGLYAEFFYFPSFEHRIEPRLLASSLGITLVTAVAGTLNAIASIVRLVPAEAMRPPAPGTYRRTLAERLGVTRIGPALRMILRQMERRPWRTALGIAGIAASVAIVVMGNFFRDAIDHIVDSQFNLSMRSDVIVWMDEAADEAEARRAVQRLPAVFFAESGRDVPVRFVAGHLHERGQIRGLSQDAQLTRIIDDRQRQASRVRDDGLVMTDRLAAKLGLRVGDTVRAEVLEGRQRVLELPLAATVRETMGLNACLERRALNRALQEADHASWFALALDRGREAELLAASRNVPRLVGVFSKAALLANVQEVSARNVRIMSTVLTLFATVIAVGVVYNNARIALAERAWELASLRVLGFTRAEVSALLLGEMGLAVAVALPLGMWLGFGLVHAVVGRLASDAFFFPVVIRPRTYAWAALAVLAAAIASALVVRRRIDRLDLVAALKTRE